MKRRWLCGILTVCLLFCMVPGFPLQTSAYVEMGVTQELVDFIKQLEGFSSKPYWDYSQWTVGYGTKCPDEKRDEYKANGIPEAEAEALLRQEIKDFEDEVNDYGKKHDLTFKQHEFDALVSLSFNCGGTWKWERYWSDDGALHQAVTGGATGDELIYAFVLWSKPHRNYNNKTRRLAEANMYLNGVYRAHNDPQGDLIPENYKYIFLDGNGGEVAFAIQGYDASEKPGIKGTFTKIPTGVDAEGNPFVYEFAGWYTASEGGTLVETLDGSLADGTALYAQWKDPQGNIVALPKGDVVDRLEITITGDQVNVRSGPGSYYTKVGTVAKNTQVVISETYEFNGTTWGKIPGGWVSLDYSNYKEVLEALKPAPVWPQAGTVTNNGVNVRSEPSTEKAETVQYKVNIGDRVTISETYVGTDYTWGKLEDGNWICMTYVKLDSQQEEEAPPAPYVTGIELLKLPTRTDYVQMQDGLDLRGSVLKISYSDGTISAVTLTSKMVTFSNAQLGEATVQVSYEGFTTSFKVNVVKATVTFTSYDGSVLSQTQYAYGETVAVPEAPVKPGDDAGEYRFMGWTPAVTACAGDATYTPKYELIIQEPGYLPGDFDGSEGVDENDADYLLGYLLFPEWYPIAIPGDVDGNGLVDENDADYLLGYLLFPEWYPLHVEEVTPDPDAPDTTDPAPSDPVATDPAPTDPAPTDPVATDPAPTDPAPSDPAATDPAATDPTSTTPEGSEGET